MSPSFISRVTIIAVLASAVLGVQADTYLGCTSSAPAATGDPAAYSAGASSSCSTYCGLVGNTPYFYYSSSTGACQCTSTVAAPSAFEKGSNTKGQCTTSEYSFYTRTATTFTYQGCYQSAYTDHTLTLLAIASSYCKTSGTAVVTPFPMTGDYICNCVAGFTVNDATAQPATCDSYVQFAYTHTADAAASGLARRNMRARLEQLRWESQRLCPGQMKACKLENMSDTYECVDTSSELESCGGCIFGEFGKEASSAIVGTDCSSLRGVSPGAATCRDSVCEAYACKKGFELVSGECVATVSA